MRTMEPPQCSPDLLINEIFGLGTEWDFCTAKPNMLACQARSRPCTFFPCQKIELFTWNLAAGLDKAGPSGWMLLLLIFVNPIVNVRFQVSPSFRDPRH